ncbi:MAG: hypothetical protein LBG18_06505 [Mediterranea sp.]|jgi:hypothetical protein|nr:hypothetical protein [Mediterranea sp.]
MKEKTERVQKAKTGVKRRQSKKVPLEEQIETFPEEQAEAPPEEQFMEFRYEGVFTVLGFLALCVCSAFFVFPGEEMVDSRIIIISAICSITPLSLILFNMLLKTKRYPRREFLSIPARLVVMIILAPIFTFALMIAVCFLWLVWFSLTGIFEVVCEFPLP